MRGWLRSDGRKGIRNVVAVVYLVECAHHVAREIVVPFRDRDVHLIGFSGCYANQYAYDMMRRLGAHPNVGAVLLVSLGCEGFDRRGLREAIAATGRMVHTVVIQAVGGTRSTIAAGRAWVEKARAELDAQPTVPVMLNELTVGTICGSANRSVESPTPPQWNVTFSGEPPLFWMTIQSPMMLGAVPSLCSGLR